MGLVSMTHAGYVAAGWAIPLALLAGYSVRTVRRGKALAQQVPPEERRWS